MEVTLRKGQEKDKHLAKRTNMSVYFSYFTKGSDSDPSKPSPFSSLQSVAYSLAATTLEKITDVATKATTSLKQVLHGVGEDEKENNDDPLFIDLTETGNGQLKDLINAFNQKSDSEQRVAIRQLVTTKLNPDLERNLEIHFNLNHNHRVPKDMKKAGATALGLMILNQIPLPERYMTLNLSNQQVFAIAMEASKSDVYDYFVSKVKNHPKLSDEEKNRILKDFNDSKFFKIVPGTMEPIQIAINKEERTVSSGGQFTMGIMTDHGPVSIMEFKLSFQIDMKTLQMKMDRNSTKFDLRQYLQILS